MPKFVFENLQIYLDFASQRWHTIGIELLREITMRIILGIIAFTLTFGLSSTLVGLIFGFPQPNVRSVSSHHKHSSAYKHKIRRLISKDVSNGRVRNIERFRLYRNLGSEESLFRSSEYHQTVRKYYEKSVSMNTASLPEDFNYAWRKHMEEWQKQADYLKAVQAGEVSRSSSVSSGYYDNTDEINRTFDQVLRIAKRYGVRNVEQYRD